MRSDWIHGYRFYHRLAVHLGRCCLGTHGGRMVAGPHPRLTAVL